MIAFRLIDAIACMLVGAVLGIGSLLSAAGGW